MGQQQPQDGSPGVAGQKSSGAQRIAALDLRTGKKATDPNGNELPDQRITENLLWHQVHRNRASLLLDGDLIYVAFSGRCENRAFPVANKSFQGWIFAFDASTLAFAGRYRSAQLPDAIAPQEPTDDPVAGGGIWQASTGLAADGRGNLYFATGNQTNCSARGDQNQIKCSPPDASGKNLSDSIVRLRVDPGPGRPPGQVSMTAVDWFTPYRKTWLDVTDLDFAAAGVVLIPNSRYLVAAGKQGMLYVLIRDQLGKFDDAGGNPFEASTITEHFHTSGEPNSLDAPGRDKVVQKFRGGESQYCAAGPNPLFCLSAGQAFPPTDRPPGVTMNDWIAWPHIHGTPVFGAFPDGRAFLYVWAEKDFLKSFRWWGRRFETTPTIAINQANMQVLAPPYLGTTPFGLVSVGMPGGMLALSIDPLQPAGGVLFASVQRCRMSKKSPFQLETDDPGFHECSVDQCKVSDMTSSTCADQHYGMLRAFDPITLRELWNNQKIDPLASDSDKKYYFSKFVPPTIAHGRVFLATASRRVIVYGMR